MLQRTVSVFGALMLAGCQAAGAPGTSSDLPKGTALPPPDFEAEPENETAADEPGR